MDDPDDRINRRAFFASLGAAAAGSAGLYALKKRADANAQENLKSLSVQVAKEPDIEKTYREISDCAALVDSISDVRKQSFFSKLQESQSLYKEMKTGPVAERDAWLNQSVHTLNEARDALSEHTTDIYHCGDPVICEIAYRISGLEMALRQLHTPPMPQVSGEARGNNPKGEEKKP